jgi:hypothetical protein
MPAGCLRSRVLHSGPSSSVAISDNQGVACRTREARHPPLRRGARHSNDPSALLTGTGIYCRFRLPTIGSFTFDRAADILYGEQRPAIRRRRSRRPALLTSARRRPTAVRTRHEGWCNRSSRAMPPHARFTRATGKRGTRWARSRETRQSTTASAARRSRDGRRCGRCGRRWLPKA